MDLRMIPKRLNDIYHNTLIFFCEYALKHMTRETDIVTLIQRASTRLASVRKGER